MRAVSLTAKARETPLPHRIRLLPSSTLQVLISGKPEISERGRGEGSPLIVRPQRRRGALS